MTDIDQWVKSLLPPELWERHCHLSYVEMAQVPELAEYSMDLLDAHRMWHLARKTQCLKSISSPE
jgi:hypothetical protein